MTYRQLEQHVPILGWVHIISGVFFLVIGVGLFLLLSSIGLFAVGGDPDAQVVLPIVGLCVGGLMFVLALPLVLAGWGLLKRKNWARVLSLIVAIINIFNVPIGTAIGVYTLYVLLQPEANGYFMGEKSSV
jgi:hypothetical protein